MEDNSRIVDGYWFSSDKEAELARAEIKKVRFLEERMNYDNPQAVYAIYQKAIDNKVFCTPVGIEFLRRLQLFLKQQDMSESIRELPVYSFTVQDRALQREETALPGMLKKERENGVKNGRRLRLSVMLNIGLAALVIAMFVITVSSETPNMTNYRRAIQNEYAAWEQELTQREQAVREKEKELEP